MSEDTLTDLELRALELVAGVVHSSERIDANYLSGIVKRIGLTAFEKELTEDDATAIADYVTEILANTQDGLQGMPGQLIVRAAGALYLAHPKRENLLVSIHLLSAILNDQPLTEEEAIEIADGAPWLECVMFTEHLALRLAQRQIGYDQIVDTVMIAGARVYETMIPIDRAEIIVHRALSTLGILHNDAEAAFMSAMSPNAYLKYVAVTQMRDLGASREVVLQTTCLLASELFNMPSSEEQAIALVGQLFND